MALTTIELQDEIWFKISDSNAMRPFFMSIVSDSNHWMFISSNGGLTAGRKNSEYALFPYYTDDKITESYEITGSKTLIRINGKNDSKIWEPFSDRFTGKYKITRNLYKNYYGNKILFEEINHDLELTFRYQWNSSNIYGFVRKAELINQSGHEYDLTMIDGIQNVLPYGVEPDVQIKSSNLVDAYKRSEILQDVGLGIFALSAIIVDKAEPSEALKANIAWSLGFKNPQYLVSSLQLNKFRNGGEVESENDVKGEKGAYLVKESFKLEAQTRKEWSIIANVNQNHSDIISLKKKIQSNKQLPQQIDEDVTKGSEKLLKLISGADGIRHSSDLLKDARHFSNVLFNIMRGGTFDLNYQIEKKDFSEYLLNANKNVFNRNKQLIEKLPEVFDKFYLEDLFEKVDDADLYRLFKEYLPLKFSRRHGDPSRPWNQFSINTHSEKDGSKILDYEGNWRDLFQNWEALAHSYPGFIEGMIFKFLNTSTFDGYNPYRVTKGGFDWETIEPDNPWSYIGYWGDHQIIYLLKFLEFYHSHNPTAFKSLFEKECFVYADVPYRIKSYQDIVRDSKNTIDFDEHSDASIRKHVASLGADGALLTVGDDDIYRVNFLEKMLATVLAKMSNFIPEGGIWMNTQRPEWNDANNALVGNGVSMVTLYYLRRFLNFFQPIFDNNKSGSVKISEELNQFFIELVDVLEKNKNQISKGFNDSERKEITDGLGEAGSKFRTTVYDNGFTGKKTKVSFEQLKNFTDVSLAYLEQSIDTNKRTDDLYHAYNILNINDSGFSISYLSEMLEGQVAVLSSGYLSSKDAVRVMDALSKSALYRKDQNSYMLYPNKDLPKFLEKNNIPEASIKKSELLQTLIKDYYLGLVVKDVEGGYHFNGNFRNAADVKEELEYLSTAKYKDLVKKDGDLVLKIFEEVFNHKAFTGRSGTFFGYEGLGSIYWHMVSKLYLAVEEVALKAIDENADDKVQEKLSKHFYEVGKGIGIHKDPKLYGAFPTDAYSHTPWHRGAQQPGMTGQVKEDILVHIGEAGIEAIDGNISFNPSLLRKGEFLSEKSTVKFVDVNQQITELEIPEQSIMYSYCQVPVIYKISEADSLKITFSNNYTTTIQGLLVDEKTSSEIFNRTGNVKLIEVFLSRSHLKE